MEEYRWRFFVLLALSVTTFPARALEQPEYKVIDRIGVVEVRKYAPHIVARTLVSGEFSNAATKGFKPLAGYIFGANDQDQNISMTAPVGQAPAPSSTADSRYWITFSMPKSWTMQTLPNPTNDGIELVQVPEQTIAVLGYKGSWSQKRFKKHESELLATLATAPSWSQSGETRWSRYDPPFVPWFMRTNEVAVEVLASTPRSN